MKTWACQAEEILLPIPRLANALRSPASTISFTTSASNSTRTSSRLELQHMIGPAGQRKVPSRVFILRIIPTPTADGRNPAPVGFFRLFIPSFIGIHPSQLQDSASPFAYNSNLAILLVSSSQRFPEKQHQIHRESCARRLKLQHPTGKTWSPRPRKEPSQLRADLAHHVGVACTG